MDTQGQDLDFWEDAVVKSVNTEVKTLLQSASSICKIDSRYCQGKKLAKKKEKDFGKAKFTDTPFADTPSRKQSSFTHQTSSAHLKKGQNQGPQHGQERGQDQNSPTTGFNVTPKKEKKDLSQINCFYYKKKGYYANKCSQKRKQESKN